MPRKRRCRVLLDEMMPRRGKFPLANDRHDLKHVVHDLGKPGIKDIEVVRLAKKEKRIIVTENIKDYADLCKLNGIDLIGVTASMSPEILDRQILAKLNKRKSGKMCGEMVKIINPPRKR